MGEIGGAPVTATTDRSTPPVDLNRWPAMAPTSPAPVRAAVARQLLRRIAARAGVRVTGPGFTAGPVGSPVLEVHDLDRFLTRIGVDGKIGFGEAYMAGDWSAPDLVAVLEAMARTLTTLVPAPLQKLRAWYDARPPSTEDNDRRGAQRNITRHYDLSNDLFASFLDETMTYSSALFSSAGFATGDEPLAAAQVRKVERLLDQTRVGIASTVLEIGTGWGELALRAARRGAAVTSVTLSEEQARFARDRVAAAGLTDRVDVRVQDYRDVTGRYDAVISVEMIEAVGERWWPTYFRTLDERLAPDGRVGLQAILIAHDRMLATRRSWTWIHKYIFPGGLILSEDAITANLDAHSSLKVVDRFRFGSSYAATLRHWRERFTANADVVDALGFDETFRRMWTFYLAYCEAGFRAGYLDVGQFVLARS
jgi:cyclopropane-fatty-acyl-phospholipid synthase